MGASMPACPASGSSGRAVQAEAGHLAALISFTRRHGCTSARHDRAFATVRAMTIVPDTKDWTWVLQHPCPECGLDTQSFPRSAIARMIRANAAAWRDVLARPGNTGLRPSPGKWSALEYGCHVRDVLRLYDQRLHLMLTQDGPRYPNWDQCRRSRY